MSALFIILVGLTVTLFRENMLISTRCIHGFMSNGINKSWTVSSNPVPRCSAGSLWQKPREMSDFSFFEVKLVLSVTYVHSMYIVCTYFVDSWNRKNCLKDDTVVFLLQTLQRISIILTTSVWVKLPTLTDILPLQLPYLKNRLWSSCLRLPKSRILK